MENGFNRKYIKMSDCPEIQDGWKAELGDWYFYTGRVEPYERRSEIHYGQVFPKGSRWLPRQDDLQGMIEQPADFVGCWPLVLNARLDEWAIGKGIYLWGHSYEQLWLAFVMHNLHQKR